MTDTTKTEALRLAEHLECFRSFPDDLAASAELRRLSAVEAELEKERKARQDAQRQRADDYAHLMAEAKKEQRLRGKAEAERDRLAAECEALRADAQRYRWLRNEAWGGNNKTGPYLVEFKPGLMPSAVTLLAEDAADAAITAAMGDKE